MGYLLKEALKTLCGINQWSYAVFAKIGQLNPKLLTWEEYYCGPESFPGLGEALVNEKPEIHSQAENRASLLVNKMMMDHHVNVVGEGLIGSVALTGQHQWIVSENFHGEAYPPQVLEEMFEQFSAGIQTIAAIPVLPHGVLQFGSYFKIKENMGFLNDVVSLVHQLSYLPSVLSMPHNNDSAISQLPLPQSRVCPILGEDMFLKEDMQTSSLISSPFSYVKNSVENPLFEGQTANIYGLFKGFMEENDAFFDHSMDDIFEAYQNSLTSEKNLGSGISSSKFSDHLLDAVVSGVLTPKENSGLSETTVTNNLTISSSYGQFNMQTNGGILGIPQCTSAGTVSSSSQCSSSIYDPNSSHNKGKDVRKSAKKRLKPGENPRPRPRDRQMIQDRVKELRGIVPNGAKCSIDALLERTIKHMRFLQGVAVHANKLKQTTVEDSKIDNNGSISKDNFEKGSTWAYEIGSNSNVCPIKVEDLNTPGQMLVEMVCEESGSFLEIADVIRGLGLTILKGTMEAMNEGEVSTRFVIEAGNNREVTRMEVLISLVRVLEKSSKMTSAPCEIESSSVSIVQ